ncbi:MAG: protein kinase domain-containing protein, partial [Anaerolineales bacterium]
MEPDRFERLRNLVLSVADLPDAERRARLAELCKDDPELLREAREILSHDTGPADILEPPTPDLGYPDPRLSCGTISHYRILERAGIGGMGVVYKAEDLALKRMVALKFLPLALANDPEARARFTREAQAAAALDHPTICAVYGIEEFEGASFIAMAYIEGETLTGRIRQGPLELTGALTIAIQVAEGLTAAHAKGVIHRDIKPGNILLNREGQVKITDFGLARIAGESAITSTGTRMGTGAYMSPEQARGDAVDHRTDIWSLGVILYEMATGRRPFIGEREESVLYKLVHEDPPPMHKLRGDIPPELERIVGKAMAKSPDDRYQRMDDMLDDLRNARRYSMEGVWPAIIHPPSPRVAPVGTAARLPDSAKRMIVLITRRGKLATITAGAIIVAAIAIGLLMVEKRADIDLQPHRVVVAAFENRTGDESLGYLGPLVAERIAKQLAEVGPTPMAPAITPSVASAAVHSSLAGQPEMRRLKALARETEAATAVSGAYSFVGDSVRFQGSVTDVRTSRLICALPAVSGPRNNPNDAIAMVTQRSAGAVAAYFNPEVQLDPGLPPPLLDAYREFVAGLGVWAEGTDYADAFRGFSRAIELDSTFVTPYFWLSACYHNRGMYAESEALIRLLERYRDRLAVAHRCMLDNWLSELGGRRAEAWRHLRQAERAAPQSYVIKQLLAQEAVQQNHPREALERFAAMAHPESVYTYGLSGS